MNNMDADNLYKPVNMADRIKDRAKERHIKLKDMLVSLDLGSNTFSNMRHGRVPLSDTLARIADYLDCSVDYLLGRTDNPDINK